MCPFTLMQDGGTAHFSDVEVERPRAYRPAATRVSNRPSGSDTSASGIKEELRPDGVDSRRPAKGASRRHTLPRKRESPS
jgi:hypothetical protein